MNNFIFYLALFFFSVPSSAETVMGVEAPKCVGSIVKTESDAKCIALFYGQFISLVGAFGKKWDVTAKEKSGIWYVYPKEPTELVPEGTVLYKISSKTGKPLGGYHPKI
jgi:hypothetical protein